MNDLPAALRESGHAELARALEAKELAGKLRRAGRPDLADALTAPPSKEAEPVKTPEQQAGEQMLSALNSSRTPWHSVGGE